MWTKEQELAIQLLLSMLEIVPEVDRVNTWMLAGAGATAALVVSNIESVVNATHNVIPGLLLSLLAISALFGCLAKFFGTKSSNARILMQSMLRALNENRETDVQVALDEYLSAFPAWLRILMLRGAKKGTEDPLFGFKKSANMAMKQSFYTVWQALFFVAFIAVAGVGIE